MFCFCKIYRTATRAKSSDSCVKVKAAVAAAYVDVGGDAVARLAVGVADTAGRADVSNIMVGFTEALGWYEVDATKVTSFLKCTAVAVAVGLLLALAGEEAEPMGQSLPLNVTRAFSASHERFAELNCTRIISDDNGILKFVLAPEIRRGMDSPRVTLLYRVPFELVMEVVVQPLELATEQVEPVYPLAQMQAHALEAMMLVPPLEHGDVCPH